MFGVLNVGSLSFLIGSSNGAFLLKILISRDSLCCFRHTSLIRLTVGTTSSSNTSLVPSWISSFDSSASKRFSGWLNSFVSEDTCFSNFSWKDLESSWQWNSKFSFSTVESSNYETSLAGSVLQICHLRNLSASSVKPSIPQFPRKKDTFQSISFKWTYLNYINFRKAARYSSAFFKTLLCLSRKNL